MSKKIARLRRAKRGRLTIKRLGAVRLSVTRTPRHIYAQIIGPAGDVVIASASTLDKEIRKGLSYFGNVDSAKKIGAIIAERALSAGIKKVAFDRSGFQYHGRIKALADAAREAGLEF